jgi:hypothetical protein
VSFSQIHRCGGIHHRSENRCGGITRSDKVNEWKLLSQL